MKIKEVGCLWGVGKKAERVKILETRSAGWSE
jgi:hypothetical protein